MITAIIQTEVADFDVWKEIFYADQPNVEKAGAKLVGLYRSLEKPNQVTMMYEAPNVELYGALMSDPERQEAIRNSGVIGMPTVTFLTKV